MNQNSKIKPDIIIVDDHLIFRQGLKAIINYEDVGNVIAEASNGEEFLELLPSLKPDLVLMDIDMPLMNGFEATEKALELMPGLKIIAFTVFSEEEYYERMFKIGARGLILKSSGFNELEIAIEIVMSGKSYFKGKFEMEENSDSMINEITTGSKNDLTSKKRKMLFFPWVANRKNCMQQ